MLLVVIGAELQPHIRRGFAAKLARYGKLDSGLSLGLSQGAIAKDGGPSWCSPFGVKCFAASSTPAAALTVAV